MLSEQRESIKLITIIAVYDWQEKSNNEIIKVKSCLKLLTSPNF